MIATLLLLSLASLPSSAWASPPTGRSVLTAQDDAQAVRDLIDDQIRAFGRRDAEGAWRHVAPRLQQQFGTADNFLRLVLSGYRPVADPRSYRYGELAELPNGDWGQLLHIIGPDGEKVQALYLLERQPDGTWRTSGCLMVPPTEGAIAV